MQDTSCPLDAEKQHRARRSVTPYTHRPRGDTVTDTKSFDRSTSGTFPWGCNEGGGGAALPCENVRSASPVALIKCSEPLREPIRSCHGGDEEGGSAEDEEVAAEEDAAVLPPSPSAAAAAADGVVNGTRAVAVPAFSPARPSPPSPPAPINEMLELDVAHTGITVCTATSEAAAGWGGRITARHSVARMSHTRTVPSLLPETTTPLLAPASASAAAAAVAVGAVELGALLLLLLLNAQNATEFIKLEWPRNS